MLSFVACVQIMLPERSNGPWCSNGESERKMRQMDTESPRIVYNTHDTIVGNTWAVVYCLLSSLRENV